ncbi:MAG: DUF3857 domain-containing protein [Flavobacteriaceae bacterium]
MKKIVTILLLFSFCYLSYSQKKNDDYEFGKVTQEELDLTIYEKDTTANAVVLYEYGSSKFIEKGSSIILQTTHYKKVKIFNAAGYKNATIKIKLYYNDRSKEHVNKIKGVTHNGTQVSKLKKSEIFKTKLSDRYNQTSFTLPNVHDGSVIEYYYVVETPFFFRLKGWNFQSSIPKVESVFNAKIPGKFLYNRKMVGTLKLTENKASIKTKCYTVTGDQHIYDCEVLRYSMKDIPAFIEEEHMTATRNFRSRIAFELSEYVQYDGHVKKYTSTWKSVDKDIKRNDDIGGQLNKKSYFENELPSEIFDERSYLKRAKKVYYHIQNHFHWNDYYWNKKNTSVKKAYKEGVGAVDEINLALINALDAAGIDAKLVMLSTRANGVPTKIHPVIAEFNYIIVKIKIGNKSYFLDATDKNLPFGVLPYRCLNGDARVMDFKNGSYWETIKPITTTHKKTFMILTLDDEGVLEGKMRVTHFGYDAIKKRKEIKTKKEDKYLENLEDINEGLEVVSYKSINLNEIEKPLIEEFDLIIEGDGSIGDKFYLYPFFFDRLEENPFKLESRQYPVDFGYSWKSDFALTINIPEGFEVETMPKSKSMALPNKKGYFMFSTTVKNQKISLSFKFILDNPYFYSNEYAYLKELYKQMIIIQNEPIVLKRL